VLQSRKDVMAELTSLCTMINKQSASVSSVLFKR